MKRPADELQRQVQRQVIDPLMRATPRLDDVRAARLAAGIEERLDVLASGKPTPGRSRRRWILGGAVILAVGGAVAALTSRTDAPTPRMEAPAGGRLHAGLGAQGRLMLVGPGSVARTVVEGRTELALESGLLVVEYQRQHDDVPPLRVRARGTTVTVTGTLFAVDARGPAVRVAVAHGTVEVSSQGESRRIQGGWSWSPGDAHVTRTASDLGADLAALEARRPPPAPNPAVAPETAKVEVDVAAGRAPPRARAPARTPNRPAALDPPGDEPVETPPVETTAGDDVEAAYATAEALMRAGDADKARAALLEVVARANGDVRAEPARVDLARLALAAGRPQEARRFLGGLADPTRDPSLTETARRLRCRVEVVAGADAQAAACLRTFRRQHPTSPHDAEVLAQLAALTTSCGAARPLLEEYLRRYPRGPFAADAATGLRACGAGR